VAIHVSFKEMRKNAETLTVEGHVNGVWAIKSANGPMQRVVKEMMTTMMVFGETLASGWMRQSVMAIPIVNTAAINANAKRLTMNAMNRLEKPI